MSGFVTFLQSLQFVLIFLFLGLSKPAHQRKLLRSTNIYEALDLCTSTYGLTSEISLRLRTENWLLL